MIPKWLYNCNLYLMITSLGLYLLIAVASIVAVPFMKSFARGFIEWLCRFYGWAFPILLSLFVLSSAVVLVGFSKYRMERKEKEKE